MKTLEGVLLDTEDVVNVEDLGNNDFLITVDKEELEKRWYSKFSIDDYKLEFIKELEDNDLLEDNTFLIKEVNLGIDTGYYHFIVREGYSVEVSGFNTESEAEEFIKWYSGQGEQDANIWFEVRKDEGIINSSSMNVDCLKTFNKGKIKSINNRLNMILEPK